MMGKIENLLYQENNFHLKFIFLQLQTPDGNLVNIQPLTKVLPTVIPKIWQRQMTWDLNGFSQLLLK
jgi:hypothetical protein